MSKTHIEGTPVEPHNLLRLRSQCAQSKQVIEIIGAGGRTRTGTSLRKTDFKSVAATITPRPPNEILQAFAPSPNGGVNCRPMSHGR
jgi:hypothetical protein